MMRRWSALVLASGALLMVAGAFAQPKEDEKIRRVQQGRPRVLFDGREDKDINEKVQRVGGNVMVPSTPFFRRIGGEERREGDWWVYRRGDRDLRFRPGDRLYYYGGRQHYWPVAPYLHDGYPYLPLSDVIRLYGGRYDYDPYYDYGRVTLCEYGYCPEYGDVRLVYPYDRQRFRGGRIPVQGYAPPYSVVRVIVYNDGAFFFGGRQVASTIARTDRNGLFATTVWVRRDGNYRLVVQSLDPYGQVVADRDARFRVD